MPGFSLQATQALPDLISTTRFELLVDPPDLGDDDTKNLALHCQQAVVPGSTLEVMTVGLHGFERNFAGRLTWDKQMAVSYVEDKNGYVQKLFRTWREKAKGTMSGNGGDVGEYGVTGSLGVLNNSGDYAHDLAIFRMWPSDLQAVQLDGSSSSPYIVQVVFTYDYCLEDGVVIDSAGTDPYY